VPNADYEIRVVPSVLDRLIDLDPRSSRDESSTRAQSVRELRRVVERDLENLLNTRNSFADLAPGFTEIGQSILTFGLPDFSAAHLNSPRDQARLRLVLEAVLKKFEPRLMSPVATTIPPTTADRSLRFHIDARLVMEPAPEQVSFDVVMPLHTGHYEVKERE
jgi:type VI secretion system protein ImpF